MLDTEKLRLSCTSTFWSCLLKETLWKKAKGDWNVSLINKLWCRARAVCCFLFCFVFFLKTVTYLCKCIITTTSMATLGMAVLKNRYSSILQYLFSWFTASYHVSQCMSYCEVLENTPPNNTCAWRTEKGCSVFLCPSNSKVKPNEFWNLMNKTMFS